MIKYQTKKRAQSALPPFIARRFVHQTPSQLHMEAFSHAAISAQRQFVQGSPFRVPGTERSPSCPTSCLQQNCTKGNSGHCGQTRRSDTLFKRLDDMIKLWLADQPAGQGSELWPLRIDPMTNWSD